MRAILSIIIASAVVVNGFQTRVDSTRTFRTKPCLQSVETNQVEDFLEDTYPSFKLLLSLNNDAWKRIRESNKGYTMFAPNESVFESLGKDKISQLADPRNDEVASKIGAYHCIDEIETADELFNSGGIITLEGEVPVERSVTGGFFGFGGNEDGGKNLHD